MILSLEKTSLAVFLLIYTLHTTSASCPYASSLSQRKKHINNPHHQTTTKTTKTHRTLQTTTTGRDGGRIPQGGFKSVKQDIQQTILTTPQPFYPPDFGHYGPFLIRLAWHCAGSYRLSDGRGGCDGGRIRFPPESNWADNANLDLALRLLEPIKMKYGEDLSWGDLIVLAGDTAIESMGGRSLGFCGGRVDDLDGNASLALGPTEVQERLYPCEVNGNCTTGGLGSTTVGLIYVNPEGHMGNPIPQLSVPDIRNTFRNMGMNDSETVALIGGGHAFGKTHGPCLEPPCGDGLGTNVTTSGFEGKWTTQPTTWSNEFFRNLIDFEWEKVVGPGGHFQWAPVAPNNGSTPDIMMLTSDIALTTDISYNTSVQNFATDLQSLEEEFQHAWYKLVTRDMGPITRCIGDLVPPVQPFQNPLPSDDASSTMMMTTTTTTSNTTMMMTNMTGNRKTVMPMINNPPDYIQIRNTIETILQNDPTLLSKFTTLAYNCASTYRQTDHNGGCNGARIRFEPELSWDRNLGMRVVIAILEEIRMKLDAKEVSMADLIVLGGHTALEMGGGKRMAFCAGRVDAIDGRGHEDYLKPRVLMSVEALKDEIDIRGLTLREYVALVGRPVSLRGDGELTNGFYSDLLEVVSLNGTQATSRNIVFSAEELLLGEDAELLEIVREFAENEEYFKEEFAMAWTKLMNADRFIGPNTNACDGVITPTISVDEDTLDYSPSEDAEEKEESEEEDVEAAEEDMDESDGDSDATSGGQLKHAIQSWSVVILLLTAFTFF